MLCKERILLITFILSLAGCANVPEDANFAEVAIEIKERTGMRTDWHVGLTQSSEISTHIENLLSKPLTSNSAVQIALLNNPELQASYVELGIAQADLIQAGLIVNPTIGGIFLFPESGGSTKLTFNLAFNFLDILMIPLRKAVAESEFEETKLKMIKFTLDLVSQTHQAYLEMQAAQQSKEISEQVLASTKASFEAAKSLRQAGNISELSILSEQNIYEQAKILLLKSEANVVEARSLLISLMGIRNPDKIIQTNSKMPAPSEVSFFNEDEIINKSVDLAILKQRLETLGHRFHVTNITALIPSFGLGGEAEREEGNWKFGPALEFAIPIFDQGQPAIARAKFEIRGLQEQYANTVIQIHITLHTLQQRLKKAKQQLDHLQKVILPLQQKILNQTQLHYNAMQVGVFDLIKAKQAQIEAKQQHVDTLLDYWLIMGALEQLRQGGLPLAILSVGGKHK